MSSWGTVPAYSRPDLSLKFETLQSLSQKATSGRDELSQMQRMVSNNGMPARTSSVQEEQDLPEVAAHRRWKASVDEDLSRLGTKYFDPLDPEHLWYAKHRPDAVKLWPERWYDRVVPNSWCHFFGDQRAQLLQETILAKEEIDKLKKEGDDMVVNLEWSRLQQVLYQQKEVRRRTGWLALIYSLLAGLPLLAQLWAPAVPSSCWDVPERCTVRPSARWEFFCALVMFALTKVIASNHWQAIGAVEASRRTCLGCYERLSAVWAYFGTPVLVLTSLLLDFNGSFSNEAMMPEYVGTGWILKRASTTTPYEHSGCMVFSSTRAMADAADFYFGSVCIFWFMVGALALCFGEFMKLASPDWYLAKGTLDVDWMLQYTSAIQHLDAMCQLRELQKEALTVKRSISERDSRSPFEGAVYRFNRAIDEFVKVTEEEEKTFSSEKLRRLAHQSDLYRVAWSFAFQAFALAVWTPRGHVRTSPCLDFSQASTKIMLGACDAGEESYVMLMRISALLVVMACLAALFAWKWFSRGLPWARSPVLTSILIILLLYSLLFGVFSEKIGEVADSSASFQAATSNSTVRVLADVAATTARVLASAQPYPQAMATHASDEGRADYVSNGLRILGFAPFDPRQILLLVYALELLFRFLLSIKSCCVGISLGEEDILMQEVLRQQVLLLEDVFLEAKAEAAGGLDKDEFSTKLLQAILRISGKDLERSAPGFPTYGSGNHRNFRGKGASTAKTAQSSFQGAAEALEDSWSALLGIGSTSDIRSSSAESPESPSQSGVFEAIRESSPGTDARRS